MRFSQASIRGDAPPNGRFDHGHPPRMRRSVRPRRRHNSITARTNHDNHPHGFPADRRSPTRLKSDAGEGCERCRAERRGDGELSSLDSGKGELSWRLFFVASAASS